jgi:hypothetical protein
MPAPHVTPAPPANPPTMSLAEYNRLTTGMTVQQVRTIVGSPGKVEAQSDFDGYRSLLLSWDGVKDQYGIAGSGMVSFSADPEQVLTLDMKSEFGLR